MSDIRELIEPVAQAVVAQATQAEIEFKEPEEGGGLISKEFFDFNMNNVYDYGRVQSDAYQLKNIRFVNENYIPLYAVNFKVDQYLPATNILSGDYEMNAYDKLLAQKQGLTPWQDNKVYTDFLKRCIEKKQYNIVLFTDHRRDSRCFTKDELRNSLKRRFQEFLNKPTDISIHREGRNNAKNYADIISNTKYYCGWAKSRTRKVSADAPVLHFLTNFYYMAKLNEQNGNFWIEPMYSVMIKREYLSYVKACLLTNTPIPVEILELWIDKKLDDKDSEYKIRSTFVKSIKTPFKASGMKVQVFDNLFDEMYSRLKMPKFKTIVERMAWVRNLSTKLLDEERVRMGIKTREQVDVNTGAAVFAAIEKLKNTTVNDEVKREVDKKLEQFAELVTELTS